MPVVHSAYKAPLVFRKGFVSTVYSGLIRSINNVVQQRERIELEDGDFLDLDWSYAAKPSKRVIILLHGMEGHAQRPYVTGVARLCNDRGIDAMAVNFRGCSGEPNRKYYSYHSGATEDLDTVITHAILKNYTEIYLYGVSLGANIILKYLGEQRSVPEAVKAGIAISVPCNLQTASDTIHSFKNVLFHDRFRNELVQRLREKQVRFPNEISIETIDAIKTLNDFDEVYTTKAHGFNSVSEYYEQSSSLQFIPNIKVPTLIINALNDSFLSTQCYPVRAANRSSSVFLEMPNHGGHVGFINFGGVYYNEKRTLDFILEHHK